MQSQELATAQQYENLAEVFLRNLQEQAQKAALESSGIEAPEALSDVESADIHKFSAKVSFTGFAVWERVQVCCRSEPPIMSTMDIFGPTVAFGGVSWGTCRFNASPSRLLNLGELNVSVSILSVLVEISWWKGLHPIGTFVGGGIGVGAGKLFGTCKFKQGSC